MPTCSMRWIVMRSTVAERRPQLQRLSVADRLVGTRRSLTFRHESHTCAGHDAARRHASRDRERGPANVPGLLRALPRVWLMGRRREVDGAILSVGSIFDQPKAPSPTNSSSATGCADRPGKGLRALVGVSSDGSGRAASKVEAAGIEPAQNAPRLSSGWKNRGMLQRVLSPVLVGRQAELSQLEDALLSVNRGEGRFVLLTGEAGIGKTRLATELSKRARKLGCDVLWGGCSEAELALPYLAFVEAVGNHLGKKDPAVMRADLGPTAAELAQLFPQFAEGPPTAPVGDPAQAKLRLFEAVVTLLEHWARDRGLLLVLDDVHWADGSTRELLDYVARRLVRSRVMVLATYRSDELDRRHPLTRAVQVWRSAGLAETITVSAMTPSQVAEMIAAILNADEVNAELASLVDARAEGNPFVLEEMLKEALDRGEILRTDAGWQRSSAGALQMPETVREAVLLRLGRLDAGQIEVLRAAAVLGRAFNYGLLVAVADVEESGVLTALESAVAEQFLEEAADASDRYRWRHALTQEAIASDTVVPKRQRIHSRAADALAGTDGTATEVARHLLGAGRTEQAVNACLRAAQEAERAVAFVEAAELLERVLPQVSDPRERALLLARMGHLRWLNGEPAAAEQLLAEGVTQLDELGLTLDAARRGSTSVAAAGSSTSLMQLCGTSNTPGTRSRRTARRRRWRWRTSGSPAFTRSSWITSAAAWRPSAPPRSPSRRPRITSASGLSPTSHWGTSARLASSSNSIGAITTLSTRATRSSSLTSSTTRSGIACTPLPAAWTAH